MKKIFLLLMFTFLIIPFANAQNYYQSSYGVQKNDNDNYYSPEYSILWKRPSLLKVYIEDNSDKSYLVKNAFYLWNNSLNSYFNFYFVNDENKADIVCKFIYKLNANVAGTTDTQYTMQNGKYYFEKAEITISYGNDTGVFKNNHQNFLTVILHEVGHSLGISYHSNNPNDVMYPNSSQVIKQGQLSQRDINTMKKIYGIN